VAHHQSEQPSSGANKPIANRIGDGIFFAEAGLIQQERRTAGSIGPTIEDVARRDTQGTASFLRSTGPYASYSPLMV
jgi:hypothetical protein